MNAKLYTLDQINIAEWHRVNMPDRIQYITDDSTGRNGCGCYLIKIDDNNYAGLVCEKHLHSIDNDPPTQDNLYSLTHNLTEEYVELYAHARNCDCPACSGN